MSVTLSILKKQDSKLNILKTLEVYLENLNNLYSLDELEKYPIIFRNKESVLGFLIESPSFIEKKEGSDFLIKGVRLGSRNLALIKVRYKQGTSPLQKLKELLPKENLKDSSFLSLLHTGKIYKKLEQQPPCLTDSGNIYMSVGAITKYFLKHEKGKQYVKDSGLKSPPEIINKYFSERLDSNKFEQLTSPKNTGMKHFTTFYQEKEEKLNVTFLQLQGNQSAYYFFKPDVVFCNSECLLRGVRGDLYSKDNPALKNRLLKTDLDL